MDFIFQQTFERKICDIIQIISVILFTYNFRKRITNVNNINNIKVFDEARIFLRQRKFQQKIQYITYKKKVSSY